MRYTARIVTVNLCELLSRPKVSQRSLILSGNYSAAQYTRRLCEKTLCGFVREEQLSRVFFSPSRKDRKDLDIRTYPLIARCQLPTPCEAFAPSAALREKNHCREIFFLAKVAKVKHEYFCSGLITAYACLATTFHDSSRLMLAVARLALKIVRRWGQPRRF